MGREGADERYSRTQYTLCTAFYSVEREGAVSSAKTGRTNLSDMLGNEKKRKDINIFLINWMGTIVLYTAKWTEVYPQNTCRSRNDSDHE